MQSFNQDLRYSLGLLAKCPGLTVIAVIAYLPKSCSFFLRAAPAVVGSPDLDHGSLSILCFWQSCLKAAELCSSRVKPVE